MEFYGVVLVNSQTPRDVQLCKLLKTATLEECEAPNETEIVQLVTEHLPEWVNCMGKYTAATSLTCAFNAINQSTAIDSFLYSDSNRLRFSRGTRTEGADNDVRQIFDWLQQLLTSQVGRHTLRSNENCTARQRQMLSDTAGIYAPWST